MRGACAVARRDVIDEHPGRLDHVVVDGDQLRVLGKHATSLERPGYFRMLTARAMTSATVITEITDCVSIVSFAQRVMGITSVGLNAIAFVNET